jgi:hypothetical protein
MRLVLLACAFAVLISAPALACRAVWEYPETMSRLTKADLPDADKQAYKKALDDGWVIHQRGKKQSNRDLMRQSVKILDEIKAKISK